MFEVEDFKAVDGLYQLIFNQQMLLDWQQFNIDKYREIDKEFKNENLNEYATFEKNYKTTMQNSVEEMCSGTVQNAGKMINEAWKSVANKIQSTEVSNYILEKARIASNQIETANSINATTKLTIMKNKETEDNNQAQ